MSFACTYSGLSLSENSDILMSIFRMSLASCFNCIFIDDETQKC